MMASNRKAIIVFILFFPLMLPITTNNELLPLDFSSQNIFSDNAIVINSDEEFEQLASTYGWTGDGSSSHPYRISDLMITGLYVTPLIAIRNTRVHFVITQCTLSHGYIGILLSNVTNGVITGNIITDISIRGIEISECGPVTISNNKLLRIRFGIYLELAPMSNIFGNIISNCSDWGIMIEYSDGCSISRNTLYYCRDFGVWVTSHDCEIQYNNFIDNNYNFFQLNVIQEDCFIDSNFYSDWTTPDDDMDSIIDIPYPIPYSSGIYDLRPRAKCYANSELHVISSPFILSPTYFHSLSDHYGLFNITWKPSSSTFDVDIRYAIAMEKIDNTYVSIATSLTTTYYTINLDDLNESTYSFWIVAYGANKISLSSHSSDIDIKYHAIEIPRVNNPFGTGRFGEVIEIRWYNCEDSYGHEVWYDLSYSPDNGVNWIPIASNLTGTDTTWISYTWNITDLTPKWGYIVKVVARCAYGAVSSDTTDGPFIIIPHTMSIPYIATPICNYTYDTSILIDWVDVSDSWNHPVSYNLYYRNINESSWTLIDSQLYETEYTWNTTLIEGESRYVIMVEAVEPSGLSSTELSKIFIISHPLDNIQSSNPPPFTLIIILGFAGIIFVIWIYTRAK